MNYTVLIAARLASTRCPNKALADVCGAPMIERLYDRIVATPEIDNVILATTNLKSDNKLVEWAKTKGIDFYRGSSNDVLGRITAAAENFKLKNT